MFTFGNRSWKKLNGVHPKLIGVSCLALTLSQVDFGVFDGLRTVAYQRELVRMGKSQTMNSLHLKQEDGYAHAVDLVPYVDGRYTWEWGSVFFVAEAMAQACALLQIPIKWGGTWGLLEADPEEALADYVEGRRDRGKVPFADGVHYQLSF